MKRFFKILSEHKWAFVLALLIGLVIALPHPYFRFEHKDVYQGVGLSGADEEPYLTRIEEVRDGHYSISSYVWAEGKDLPYLLSPLSEIVFSGLGRIFGLDLIDTVTLGRLVFPAIVFLLIYALVWQWSKRKPIALAASTTVLIFSDLFSLSTLRSFFLNHEVSHNFLTFSRLVSPSVHLIFFFGFLLLFWLFLQKKKTGWGITAGIALGLSFYTYLYSWTFLFAYLGCLALICLFKKKWTEMKGIALVVLIALVVAIPYFINLWQAIHHPFYPEISSYFGMVRTHLPHLGILSLVLLIVFLLFFPKEKKGRYAFLLALVLAPLVVLNQQVITGREMQIGHYHWYYHQPLAAIFLIIILFELIEKKFKGKILPMALLSLILLVNLCYALTVQINSYRHWEKTLIENQRYGPVFDWFKDNTQKDQVVMADETLSYLIPAYTFLNTVSAEDGHYTLAGSEKEMMERIFLKIRLDGIREEDAREYFFKNREYVSAAIYGRLYKKLPANYGSIPDEKLVFLTEKYREFLSFPFEKALKKYQSDYLVWDTLNHPEWQVEKEPFLRKIKQVNEFVIYKVL